MEDTTTAVAKASFEVAVSDWPGKVSERHRLARDRIGALERQLRVLTEQTPARQDVAAVQPM